MKKKINILGKFETNFPLAEFSSFKVGGRADYAAWPQNIEDVQRIIDWTQNKGIPVTILGSGSNVLISDLGVEGIVVFTTNLKGVSHYTTSQGSYLLSAGSGSLMSDASYYAAQNSMFGLTFIYSMPGTTGGAVWMNARCYGSEVANVLESLRYIDIDTNTVHNYRALKEDFAYKFSPFQTRNTLILECNFRLSEGNKRELLQQMREFENDRRSKGHFSAPCAGSIFKNNRVFGAPTGAVIDELNMRGMTVGAAKISDLHANIIINMGTATACDISQIMDIVHERVLHERGFNLEAEVIKIGRW